MHSSVEEISDGERLHHMIGRATRAEELHPAGIRNTYGYSHVLANFFEASLCPCKTHSITAGGTCRFLLSGYTLSVLCANYLYMTLVGSVASKSAAAS